MTYEQAAYFRLLLLLGFPEPLDAFFDDALEREDPLSDVILSLVDCGGDRKAQLAVLHEYTQAAQVDYAVVGRYVLDFACAKKDEGWPLEKVTDLLWRASRIGERYGDLWWSVELCDEVYEEEDRNWLSLEEFWEMWKRVQRDMPIFSAAVHGFEEPWYSMNICTEYYDRAQEGICSMEDFVESFENFLRGEAWFSVPVRTTPQRETFWQKLRKWWKR